MNRAFRPTRLRATALTLVGISALLPLAACASSAPASSDDLDADITLEMWTGQTDAVVALAQDLADEFHELHPNVTIKVSHGASTTPELLQKITAGFAGNNYPDISYAFGSWAGELEASGRSLDISEQVADPAVKWDELPAAARQTVQPTGAAVIGIPAIVDDLALIYNKSLFDAAGIEYPTDDWTWDDLRVAAKAITDESAQTWGFAYPVSGSEETVWQFWPLLWQNGGQILSDDGTTATFDDDAGVTALSFLRDVAVEDKSAYLDQTDDKTAPLFNAGHLGMVIGGPWSLADAKTAGVDYGVTQLPGVDGNHQTVSGPDFWALFDHKDAARSHWAYEFTQWLTAPEQNERWASETSNLPLRSSSLDSASFQAQVEQTPGFDVFAENLANATTARPTVPGYVGLSEAIGGAISSVLQGQGDPASALEKAADQADQALSGS